MIGLKQITIEDVLQYKGEKLNIMYVIRALPLSEIERTKKWNGIKYDSFEDWFYNNCN